MPLFRHRGNLQSCLGRDETPAFGRSVFLYRYSRLSLICYLKGVRIVHVCENLYLVHAASRHPTRPICNWFIPCQGPRSWALRLPPLCHVRGQCDKSANKYRNSRTCTWIFVEPGRRHATSICLIPVLQYTLDRHDLPNMGLSCCIEALAWSGPCLTRGFMSSNVSKGLTLLA